MTVDELCETLLIEGRGDLPVVVDNNEGMQDFSSDHLVVSGIEVFDDRVLLLVEGPSIRGVVR